MIAASVSARRRARERRASRSTSRRAPSRTRTGRTGSRPAGRSPARATCSRTCRRRRLPASPPSRSGPAGPPRSRARGCRSWPGRSPGSSAKPSRVTITFSGFRSRWTIPASWARARASASWAARATVRRSGSGARIEELAQRPAVDELHDDEGRLGILADLVDRDDRGVVQGRGRPRLRLEAGEPLGVERELAREGLDRDVAPEARVPGPVDLPHPAGAQAVHDLVLPEPCSGRDVHQAPVDREPTPRLRWSSGKVPFRVTERVPHAAGAPFSGDGRTRAA